MARACGSKQIGFLKTVTSNYIDKEKLALVESIKVKTNEFDERLLAAVAAQEDPKAKLAKSQVKGSPTMAPPTVSG